MIQLQYVENVSWVGDLDREALEAAGFSTDIATDPEGAIVKLGQDAPPSAQRNLQRAPARYEAASTSTASAKSHDHHTQGQATATCAFPYR